VHYTKPVLIWNEANRKIYYFCVSICLSVHGSSFAVSDRGHCKCSKGEIVCTKAQFNTPLKEGKHLWLGWGLNWWRRSPGWAAHVIISLSPVLTLYWLHELTLGHRHSFHWSCIITLHSSWNLIVSSMRHPYRLTYVVYAVLILLEPMMSHLGSSE